MCEKYSVVDIRYYINQAMEIQVYSLHTIPEIEVLRERHLTEQQQHQQSIISLPMLSVYVSIINFTRYRTYPPTRCNDFHDNEFMTLVFVTILQNGFYTFLNPTHLPTAYIIALLL